MESNWNNAKMILFSILFIYLGIILIIWGFRTLRGGVNVLLIDTHEWGYYFIPLGLMMFFLGLAILPFVPEEWRLPCVLIGMALMLIGISIPHKFLYPPWMKWLKQTHGSIIPLLQEEIRKIGYYEWNRRIKTQNELEEWIQEVRQKHKRNRVIT